MGYDLVRFAVLKDVLTLSAAAYTNYPSFSQLHEALKGRFEEFLGRGLENTSRTETVTLGLVPTRLVPLRGVPVGTVSSVTVATVNGTATLGTGDYRIIPGYGLRLAQEWSEADITVAYTGGAITSSSYPQGTYAALERAGLMQLIHDNDQREHMGATSVTTEGGTVTRPELGLLREVRETLQFFRHPSRIGGV